MTFIFGLKSSENDNHYLILHVRTILKYNFIMLTLQRVKEFKKNIIPVRFNGAK